MKLTIVSGSQRSSSQSLCVAHYLKTVASEYFSEIQIMDLFEINLPLWNEGVWQNSDEWKPWQAIATQLESSDAFIFITPEWHGMATPALKNFLLLTTAKELSHKPALLSSVSASINGVYPISELRMTGNKNNHVCFLPDHLVFRNVETLLVDNQIMNDSDFQQRCEYTLQLLAAYAAALAPVHKTMLPLGKPHTYGM